MNLFIQKQMCHYKEWRKGVLTLSLLELLLIVVVSSLVITAVYVCTRFTTGPTSMTTLKNYLNELQLKFKNPQTVNAETERGAIEILLNKVKTSCDEQSISDNVDLKGLFDKTSKQIKSITENMEVGTRSSWQKLHEVTTGFNEYYFLGTHVAKINK